MNVMKPLIGSLAGLSILLAVGLSGCTRSVLSDVGSGQPFVVSVSDGGYVSSDNDSSPHRLHSQDNDFITQFTAGDAIGIYAVNTDKRNVDAIENLKLIAVGKGSDIVWQAAIGTPRLALKAGLTYYAYYPYRADAPVTDPTVDPNMKGGEKIFFKNLISGWNPDKNQSTHDQYAASDLMVAKGVINNESLKFSMQHQMALTVLDFTSTTAHYTFTNSTSIPDYSVAHPPMPVFNGFTPWHAKDYVFRYLIRSDQTAQSLTGGYASSIVTWTCPLTHIAQHTLHIYRIGDPEDAPVEVSYNLQAGDFLLKDGVLLPKPKDKDAELDDVYKAAACAVVLKAGVDATGSYADTETYYTKNTRSKKYLLFMATLWLCSMRKEQTPLNLINPYGVPVLTEIKRPVLVRA